MHEEYKEALSARHMVVNLAVRLAFLETTVFTARHGIGKHLERLVYRPNARVT